MSKKKLNLFILGSYGQHNAGDEALLAVMLDKFKNCNVVVNSHNPGFTKKRFGVGAVYTYSIRDFPKKLKAFLKSDAIIYGGGTLIVPTLKVLLFMALGNLLARILGKKVIYLGVGVGFLGKSLKVKSLVFLACSLANLVTLRDQESANELKKIGIRRKVFVTADPVLLLKPASKEQAFKILKKEGVEFDNNLVGIGPRFHDSVENYGKMLKALAKTCDFLIENYRAKIILLPIQHRFLYNKNYADWKYDDIACQDLLNLVKNKNKVLILKEEYMPGEILAVIGYFKLFIGAPLHSLLFALKQAVPLIGLNYSSKYDLKISSLFKKIGQEEFLVESYGKANFSDLRKKVQNIKKYEREKRVTLEQAHRGMEKRAGENFKLFFNLWEDFS